MRVQVNLRHLDRDNLELTGEIEPAELEIEGLDPVVRVERTLKYSITVQKLEENLLAQGNLSLDVECDCVRCLKTFSVPIRLPDWVCHIPLSGEESIPADSDEVDLTPFIREDIILSFPQQPLCEPECGGLKSLSTKRSAGGTGGFDQGSNVWGALDKLKLK